MHGRKVSERQNPMDRYDRDSTERLARAVERCRNTCSADLYSEALQREEKFLDVVDRELSCGADPTWRETNGVSALEMLLLLKPSSTKRERVICNLLSRCVSSLPVPLERIPLRDGPLWNDPLYREDYQMPTGPIGRQTPLLKTVSPMDMLLTAGHAPHVLRQRLDILMCGAERIESLFSAEGRQFAESERPVLFMSPLLAAANVCDWNACLVLLEQLQKCCTSRGEISNILNARTAVVENERVLPDVVAHRRFSASCASPLLGETVLHVVVRRFKDDTLPSRFVSEVLANGANPFIVNSDGLTPYGLACELGCMELVRDPYRLHAGKDPHVESEFTFSDVRNRILLARLTERMERVFTVQWQYTLSDVGDLMKNVLEVYKSVEHKTGSYWEEENRLVLSQALARLVMYGSGTGYVKEIPRLVKILLGAGADPRYALPGHGWAWYEAALNCGSQRNDIGKAFLTSPMKNEKSFLTAMTDEEFDCLCDLEIADMPELDLEAERRYGPGADAERDAPTP